MEVRRLGPGDEGELRAVRLTALASDPDVFGSTLAREEQMGTVDWLRRLSPPSATFVVARPAAAMAWGVPDADDVGLVHLFGMWVAPDLRGSGAADALITAVTAWAVERSAERIELTVLEGNARAEAVYRRHGFTRTGATEVRSRDGHIEASMVRMLLDAPAVEA